MARQLIKRIIPIIFIIIICIAITIPSYAENMEFTQNTWKVRNHVGGSTTSYINLTLPYISPNCNTTSDYIEFENTTIWYGQRYYSYTIDTTFTFSTRAEANSMVYYACDFDPSITSIETYYVGITTEQVNQYVTNYKTVFRTEIYCSSNGTTNIVPTFRAIAGAQASQNWSILYCSSVITTGQKYRDTSAWEEDLQNQNNQIMQTQSTILQNQSILQNSISSNAVAQHNDSVSAAAEAHSDAKNSAKYEQEYMQSQADSNDYVGQITNSINQTPNTSNILLLLNNIKNIFINDTVKTTITFPKGQFSMLGQTFTLWNETTIDLSTIKNNPTVNFLLQGAQVCLSVGIIFFCANSLFALYNYIFNDDNDSIKAYSILHRGLGVSDNE